MAKVFDDEMKKLFETLTNVLSLHIKKGLQLNQEDMIKSSLDKYVKAYKLTNSDIHRKYIKSIFDEYRFAILRGGEDWVKDNEIAIQFGQELDKVPKKIRVRVSDIYKISLQMKENTIENITGLIDNLEMRPPELDYPKKIVYQMYRLFEEVIDPEDKKALKILSDKLAEELGIPVKDSTPMKDGGIMGFTWNILNQLGVSIPKEKLPKDEEILPMVNNVIKGPEFQNLFSSMTEDFEKEPKDLGNVIKKFADKLGGSGLMDKIRKIAPEVDEKVKELPPNNNNNN